MERIRFGIVGCGRIAQRHAQHISKVGRLTFVCDVIEEKAKALATEYGCEYALSIQEMLKNRDDIDVVSVCSPNGLHAEHCLSALASGLHVLCEKPMALSVHDCGEMIKAAEKANRRLFIVKQNRVNPPVEAVKKAIDEGRFGKVFSVQLTCFWNRNNEYYKDWKGTKSLDGGTLFTQFSHFIDLLYWMVGDVKSVNGFVANYNHRGVIEFEDTGVVSVEFYN